MDSRPDHFVSRNTPLLRMRMKALSRHVSRLTSDNWLTCLIIEVEVSSLCPIATTIPGMPVCHCSMKGIHAPHLCLSAYMVSKPMHRIRTPGFHALFSSLPTPSSSANIRAGGPLVLAVIIHFDQTLLAGLHVDRPELLRAGPKVRER